jgi:alpha-ribazole phosphatase
VRRAILARHGESEYSAHGLLNGDARVPVGLTARGREEAARLGEVLRDEPLELVVTTEFQRVRETVAAALRGRELPQLVVPELNDPRYGAFEGRALEDYRSWAAAAPSSEAPPGGGESRRAVVRRYTVGYRRVLARPEATILVVAHSLPIAYAQAVERLEGWLAAPTW